MAKRVLGRDQILGQSRLKQREIEAPELGGVIIVRELTGVQSAIFQQRSMDLVDARNARIKDGKALAELQAQVIVWGCVDEEGKPLFTKQDIPQIIELGSAFTEHVAGAVLELSNMDKAGRRRAEKNFETPQTSAPGTA